MNRASVVATAAITLLTACSYLADPIDVRASAACIEVRSSGRDLVDEAEESLNRGLAARAVGNNVESEAALRKAQRLMETHALLVLGNPDCWDPRSRADAEQTLRERDRDRAR